MCRHLFRCRFAYFNSLSLMFESRIPHTTRSRSNESSRSAKLQDEASSFNSVKNFSNVFSGSWFFVKNLNRFILFHSLSDGNIHQRRRIILPRFGPFLRYQTSSLLMYISSLAPNEIPEHFHLYLLLLFSHSLLQIQAHFLSPPFPCLWKILNIEVQLLRRLHLLHFIKV